MSIMLKYKINWAIIEPNSDPCANRWFVIKKKDKSKLRFIQDVRPANSITIQNADIPFAADKLAKSIWIMYLQYFGSIFRIKSDTSSTKGIVKALYQFIPEKVLVFVDDIVIKESKVQNAMEVKPGVQKYVNDQYKTSMLFCKF
ncbi:hypothetical protein BB559_003592 [Furculomyces boomerangus]|uniref:Reverse transcriptase domain-containing protein n=2 Tax=Harpellales TaxID=61421 RepID=A0A2T9YKH1_9FUNG|nr:hypothetical protein BB559_003592 [Furculomyces boomerangus]PWA00797.1 hypothetical protein BB558_003139 [Smittium angustum]